MHTRNSPSASRGFTLIEIMVVVVLIAVAATFITVNLGRDEGRLASLEADKFRALVQHLREESVITGRVLGIVIDDAKASYRFVEYEENWKDSEDDGTLRPRELSEGVKLRYDRAKGTPKDTARGLVMVEPMGSVTPFVLTFTGGERKVVVTVDENEEIVIQDPSRG